MVTSRLSESSEAGKMDHAVGLMEMTAQASGESKRKASTLENGAESSAKARRTQASQGHKASPPWTGADIRYRLNNQQFVYGTCCTSTSPKMPDALCKAGIGVVFIDTEHVPIVRDTLSWMCQAFDTRGVPPLVRVPEPEPYRVTEYLDAGARGIVAPYLESVEQAKMLVGATKLRPLKGELLQHILDNLTPIDPTVYVPGGPRTNEILYKQVEEILAARGDPAPHKTTAFMKKKCGNNFLMLNIESVAAVGRLEELAAVPGVDGFLVGPHDLSCNFGVPEEWDSDVFHSAIDKIIAAAEKFSIGCGIHYSFSCDLEYQAKWGRSGARFVMHSTDTAHVASKVASDLAHIAARNGDPAPPGSNAASEVEGV